MTGKDIILGVIGRIGVNGGTGHVIEYTGEAIRSLSMDGRMTVCNMSIEAGARAGMIAPDDTTFEYVRGRQFAPQGADFDAAVERWKQLPTEPGAVFDKTEIFDASTFEPFVTWGTNPGMVAPVSGHVPDPASFEDSAQQEAAARALQYMGLEPGTPIQDIRIDRIFVGACTNARLEDLRAAAEVVRGRKVHPDVYAMVVPRLGQDQARGRGRRAGPHLHRGGPGTGEWQAVPCAWE